jgi:hypothetical protein
MIAAVRSIHSQQMESATTSVVWAILKKPLANFTQYREPRERFETIGASAEGGKKFPHRGIKGHLSTLAIGTLVFSSHPTPIASVLHTGGCP